MTVQDMDIGNLQHDLMVMLLLQGYGVLVTPPLRASRLRQNKLTVKETK